MGRSLKKSELSDIAHGACFLGGGGGGTLRTAMRMVEELDDNWQVPVVSVEEAASCESDLTCVSLFGGSPTSTSDLTVSPAVIALKQMNLIEKGRIAYTVALEVGAINTIVPCIVAERLGMAVVDGDGAGRAVPELTHTTYSVVDGLSMCPTIMASGDERKHDVHTVVLRLGEYQHMKEVFVGIIKTGPFKRIAGVSIWPIKSSLLKQAVPIRGTLELCLAVGRALKSEAGIDAAIEVLKSKGRDARRLFTGILEKIELGGSDLYDVGQLVISKEDETVRVFFQNENMVAWSSKVPQVIGTVPDSICAIRNEDNMPFSNGVDPDHFLNKEVTLVGVKAAEPLRTNEKIAEAFRMSRINAGYAGPYVNLVDVSVA